MPLPEFNQFGDLPEGRHVTSLAEVITRAWFQGIGAE
jgi:hypothetical protein